MCIACKQSIALLSCRAPTKGHRDLKYRMKQRRVKKLKSLTSAISEVIHTTASINLTKCVALVKFQGIRNLLENLFTFS